MAAHTAAAAARSDDAALSSAAHPALSKPALLSHVFKFAARKLKDVKLLHVSTAWEDTAVNFCPWMWERITAAARGVDSAPPLEGTPQPSLEQWSQHCFNHAVCRVWARGKSYTPSLLSRLVNPTSV
jgi:hypothetical protein